MILGIGTDIVSVVRVEGLLKKFKDKFISKILSLEEIEKMKILKEEHFAYFLSKKFASKEAFSKALGLGIGRGINFSDITISNDMRGKPFIKLSEKAMKFLKTYYRSDWKDLETNISISDEKNLSIAFVIISKK